MNRRKVAIGAAVVCMALVAGATVAWTRSDLASLSGALERELELAAKSGVLSDPVQASAKRAVAPSGNAAPNYQAAISLVAAHRKAFTPVTTILERRQFDSIDWADAAVQVRTFEPIYKELLIGSKKKGLDFRRKWSMGFAMPVPEFGDLLLCSRMMAVKALLASRNGRPEEALDAIETQLRFAKHIGSEGMMMSLIIYLSRCDIALQVLNEIVLRHPDGRTVRRAREVAESVTMPDTRPSVALELFSGRELLRMVSRDRNVSFIGTEDKEAMAALRLAGLTTFRRAYETTLIRELRTTYEALPEDPSEVVQVVKAFEASERRVDQMAGTPGAILRLLVPPNHRLASELRITAARRAVTVAGLSRMRGEHALPYDPWSGKPLPERRIGDRVQIYSVGPDKEDDSGRSRPLDESHPRDFDIVFTLPTGSKS